MEAFPQGCKFGIKKTQSVNSSAKGGKGDYPSCRKLFCRKKKELKNSVLKNEMR